MNPNQCFPAIYTRFTIARMRGILFLRPQTKLPPYDFNDKLSVFEKLADVKLHVHDVGLFVGAERRIGHCYP